MSVAFYNEIDAYAAGWLRNLITAGELVPGYVDTRSITDVSADDLIGYDQCHFFAGIGGWPYALRLADWPDDEPVWTGSCPCQPLSSVGQRKGHADERHLWPAFYLRIALCRPATIFGEQVASKDGREWLAGVRADLEGLGYAVGAADLCAASVGAPHIRQRLFWVADDTSPRLDGIAGARVQRRGSRPSDGGGLGDANGTRPQGWRERSDEYADQRTPWAAGDASWLGNTAGAELRPVDTGAWSDHEWLPCLDGKARRTQSGLFPLADGVSTRVGRLRAYGNAIVPQVAAEFVAAFMETRAQPAPGLFR